MKYTHSDMIIIIPCKNEADNISNVLDKLLKLKSKAIIVGIDPGTNDATAEIVKSKNCIPILAKRSGYDPVVCAATDYALEHYDYSVLLYADAGNKYDYAKSLEMIEVINSGADMVLANRLDTNNSMLWHQKLGTQIILFLINLAFRKNIKDISPFRLVRSSVFEKVTMKPQMFRWPSELLVKSLACKLSIGQIDVESLTREGNSKVSGSLKNSIKAGVAMFSSLKFVNYKGVS
jgi:glycosyltransferase involved in cell wall biosynthesis